ncbi:helix-turn-helix domain-containing protein [Roseovarius pacificus]|uniref:helix-turn-helix domain-containing protein n=1 Tax=Roseovarius pacificus TaxID=337701 RepID=UPI002A187747|nr:helix-turn-helix domain-containing protein [Roseovarius pacificus]
MARDFDMLGDPIPDNHGKPGANGHTPNAKTVNRVRTLHASGVPKKTIAEELGISQPTLNKHYFKNGRLNMRAAKKRALTELKAKMILRLEEAADKGNVSAIKALIKFVEEEELAELARSVADADDAPKRKSAPLPKGKKEQLTAEAAALIDGDDLLNPERFH